MTNPSELNGLLNSNDGQYGSTTTTTSEDDLQDDDSFGEGFHLGKGGKLAPTNIWTSSRYTESYIKYGDEYDTVPSLMTDNFAMVLDSNLGTRDTGKIYYAQSSFYRTNQEPEYAITVNDDIFGRIIKEVNDAHSIPCGLYFCCHGGEGADSHEDYVDIEFAWAVLGVLFFTLVVLSAFDA